MNTSESQGLLLLPLNCRVAIVLNWLNKKLAWCLSISVTVTTDISEQVVVDAALSFWNCLSSSWMLQRELHTCGFGLKSTKELTEDSPLSLWIVWLPIFLWPFTAFSHLGYAKLEMIIWKNHLQTTSQGFDQRICMSQFYLVWLCQVHIMLDKTL